MTKPKGGNKTKSELISIATQARWDNPAWREKVMDAMEAHRRKSGKSDLGYVDKSTENRAAGLCKIQIGDRFGDLVVEEKLGKKPYGKVSILFWRCRCSCGNTIDLPTRKLRNKRTSQLYTACEDCSMKVCFLCGEKYPRSRRYDFCSSPACCTEMERRCRALESQRRKELIAQTPEVKEALGERYKKYNKKNPGRIWKYIQSLPPEKREERAEKARRKQRKRIERLRENPKAYEEYKERQREHSQRFNQRKAQRDFLRDAQKLIEMLNNDK